MKKVVIVGGGINGLVSANYLIKGGYDVTIIEKKEFIGGRSFRHRLSAIKKRNRKT